jgi:glycosyltransferase involved in cell wall biosynthesis
MRVAVNALFLHFPHSGIGQYLVRLMSALGAACPDDSYWLLAPPGASSSPTFPPNVQVREVPLRVPGGRRLEKLLWEQRVFPHAAGRMGADLLHIPYFATPLHQPLPTVVTIHDMIPFRMPVYMTSGAVRAYQSLVSRASRRAARILTVSDYSRQEIQELLDIPKERIHVVLEAAGEQFHPCTDPQALASARERYGVGPRYLLYVGGFDARKNVSGLVQAFAQLVTDAVALPDLHLMIAGDTSRLGGATYPDWRPLAQKLGVMERIRTGLVADADLPLLYSGAAAYVFPSLYEGFGLNPLEAMACGAPVVCSNRTSLPEVVSDAAVLVDPTEPAAMAAALKRVLHDTNLQAQLRARGLAWAAQFSWERAAHETRAVYQQALTR